MSDLIVDTNQEAFDFVVRHFIKQRERAVSPSGPCMYRAPDGKRCAVGVLIKDEAYKRNMEGLAVMDLDGRHIAWPFLDVGDVDGRLLTKLQRIHDVAFAGLVNERALGRLREVATEYNLDTTVLETEYAPLVEESS